MATVAQDTFTDTSGTLLANHTPDIGTGWTISGAAGGEDPDIQSNQLRMGGWEGPEYAVEGTDIGSDEMDVSARTWLTSTESTRTIRVTGRLPSATANAANMYLGRRVSGSGQTIYTLRKRVGGSESQLGSYTDGNAPGTQQVMKLALRTDAKKLYVDGTERISSPDESLTGNRFAGLGGGRIESRMDDWLSEDVPPPTGPDAFAQRQPREDWLLRTHRVAEHQGSA